MYCLRPAGFVSPCWPWSRGGASAGRIGHPDGLAVSLHADVFLGMLSLEAEAAMLDADVFLGMLSLEAEAT